MTVKPGDVPLRTSGAYTGNDENNVVSKVFVPPSNISSAYGAARLSPIGSVIVNVGYDGNAMPALKVIATVSIVDGCVASPRLTDCGAGPLEGAGMNVVTETVVPGAALFAGNRMLAPALFTVGPTASSPEAFSGIVNGVLDWLGDELVGDGTEVSMGLGVAVGFALGTEVADDFAVGVGATLPLPAQP